MRKGIVIFFSVFGLTYRSFFYYSGLTQGIGLKVPVVSDIHTGQPLAAIEIGIDTDSMPDISRKAIGLGRMAADNLLA